MSKMSKKASAKQKEEYALMQDARAFFQTVIEACMSGDLPGLEALIEKYLKDNKGISFDDITKGFKSEGKNLLHIAASSGHSDILRYFTKKCSSIEDIIDAKDDKGMTPLIYATISESEESMSILLSLKANVNAVNNDGASCAHFAAGDGSISRLTLLEEHGAKLDLSSKSGTVFHWAAGKGHADTIQFLISKGLIHNIDSLNSQGLPAVILAAVALSDDSVCKLVNAGGNVGYLLSGNLTLLHLCSEHGLEHSVRSILLTADGKKCVTVATDDGNLPIHLAAMSGHEEIMKMLLSDSLDTILSTLPTGSGVSAESSVPDWIAYLLRDGKERLDAWNRKYRPDEVPENLHVDPEHHRNQSGQSPSHEPVTAEVKARAEELKTRGNEFFAQKDFESALAEYSQAIELDDTNEIYWSNRSACHLALKNGAAALQDAQQCRLLKPKWPKGCLRLANAYLQLGEYENAAVAAFEGCKLDNRNQELKKILQEAVKLGQKEHKKSST